MKFAEATYHPNSRRESGQHILPDDTHDSGNGKILLTLERQAGWPKNLAGFQGPFITSLQALS